VPPGGAELRITYLARGMAWAPSYRVTLGEESRLHLEQKAVLRNELEELEEARVKLISGYPSIEFSHVRSPLAPGNDWATFFRELQRRTGADHAMASNVMSQIQSWEPDRGGAPDLDLVPGVEGVDIHYQDIGVVSLREGESLLVPVVQGEAPFERVVEWIIPDTRDAQGRHRERNRWSQEEELLEPEVWDAIRFRNPLTIPMTTAPAMVIEQGRFRGQRLSTWVNPGDETTLRITRALSIHTLSSEQEEEGARDLVRIGGHDYRRTRVRGELQITSYRAEPVKLLIRRALSGEVLEADGDPTQVLREEGATSVNPRTELRWELELAPREERTLTYLYHVRVRD
jgi:hypothetical protein